MDLILLGVLGPQQIHMSLAYTRQGGKNLLVLESLAAREMPLTLLEISVSFFHPYCTDSLV